MPKGFDASVRCTDVAQAFADHGYTFVGRYLGANSEDLTKSEAIALSKAGLYIVSIVENGSPTKASFFTREQGFRDGAGACERAQAIGQPEDAPLYFAVDFDALGWDIHNAIVPYFRGVAEGIRSATHGGQSYPIGVYGSGRTCNALLQHELVTHTWLAQSTGWGGFDEFHDWNIKQTAETHAFGISIDGDISRGHGGGYRVLN